MSFIIAIHVQEGLVLASDSRTTYNSTVSNDGKETKQLGVHITDTTYKTFLTPTNVGISTCGNASINNKPIAGFIEDFIILHKEDDVEAIVKAINPYFNSIAPSLDTDFIVGGYTNKENGEQVQKLYQVKTANNSVEEINTSTQGAIWDGETSILSRLINDVYLKSEKEDKYIPFVHYDILWNYLTLQDAVDFARYAVQTTINTMRFQKRVKTVGGPIDILVIKPNESRWISRKELQ